MTLSRHVARRMDLFVESGLPASLGVWEECIRIYLCGYLGRSCALECLAAAGHHARPNAISPLQLMMLSSAGYPHGSSSQVLRPFACIPSETSTATPSREHGIALAIPRGTQDRTSSAT